MPTEPRWRTASQTSDSCVEVADDGDHVLVRNSRYPDGAVLSFTLPEWRAFEAGVRAGIFAIGDQE